MTVTPGSDVSILYSPLPAAPRTDTGTAFVSGLSLKGRTTGNLGVNDYVTSIADFTAKFGARQSFNGPVFDAVETAFAEGVSRLYFSRQAGPSAVLATKDFPTSTPKFTAKGKGPGAYYNDVYVAVASGVITVYYGGTGAGNIVEVSPALADSTAAAAWAAASSSYIDITPGASGALTDVAVVALASGADDRASITGTEKAAALARFVKDLGPGNVALPGDTLSASHLLIGQHCRDNNRFGYCDVADAQLVSTITSIGLAARAFGTDVARHIQLLDGWITIPGLTASTTRSAPPSGLMLGLAARVDGAGNPNRAVALPNVISRTAQDVHYHRTDADRGALSDAGITPILLLDQRVGPYDDVTPVDPDVAPEWLGAGGNRLVMRIVADANAIARSHMFAQVDGTVELGHFQGDLRAMLAGWYTRGALFGGSPAEAFRVDVADPINTLATLQARQLKAALTLRISPNAREVRVSITNLPLTAAL